ncbi:MAG: glycosyl transferase group 1 [Betaproteobacteria bacterium]|nr:glycosyl transferase group 1 [Betaproteobacteria bacterium]
MKVGFFFNDPFPRAGGVFTYQQDIFRCFLKLAGETEHEFHIICEHDKADSFSSLELSPNVHVSPMARRRSLHAAASLKNRVMRALGYALPPSEEAVVLADKGIEFSWSIGHYEHEAFDVPYITTVFDLQHRLQPWFPEVSRGGLWEEREDFFFRYLNRAAYVITGTEEGRRQIEGFYQIPSRRVRVLALPTPSFALDAPYEDPAARLEALGIRGRYLFYPAQFWAHKNHANLLHALRLLNTDNAEPFQLALVGSDHGNLDHVRALALSLGVERHVHFLGFVSQDDLIALYRGAFALVYVSLFGPDNLPPLEAFALQCPLIMSNYDGAREQLQEGPLYVDATDPAMLAAAVKRLLQIPEERPRMLALGRARAQQWTGLDYVRGIFAILDEFEATRRCWRY